MRFTREQWDALHWDDRAMYLNGLAQVWQARAGGGVGAAVSSHASTVEAVDEGVAGLTAFGIGVSQEEVPQ